MATISDLLDAAERRDGHRPLLTFADPGTGERTELSVATAANWVRKTGNLLVEDFSAGPGAMIGMRPFTHWAAPLIALGTWATGAGLVTDGAALVWFAAENEVGAVTGRPLVAIGRGMAGRCTAAPEDLGADHGFAEEVLAYPDALDAPAVDPSAWALRGPADLRHDELLTTADSPALGRVLLAHPPLSRAWCETLVRAVATGGSIVLVRGETAEQRDRIAAEERVDTVLG